jgi:hypothetical protein
MTVAHDPCWLGLASDADIVVEGRILSEALRNLNIIFSEEKEGALEVVCRNA